MTAAVALVGVAGFGGVHLERLAPLLAAGRVHLAAACDVRPPDAALRDRLLPAGTPFFTSHHDLLRQVRPDAVIVATPPHTHTAITADALRAGADVLVEKPPFARLADHDLVARVERETGRRCQVGFQSLASPALAELLTAVDAGRLGAVETVALAGSWTRTDAYYQRTRWAGRRWLDGKPIPDGALSNPFAHGVMNVLAVATAAGSGDPRGIELELYRTRPIEVEDTGCLRIQLASGIRAAAAVTLCASRQRPPWMLITGTAGRARLVYTEDRLQLPGDPRPRDVPGRITLLENLLDHRADPERTPLLAPLDRVRPFTTLVEAIHTSPAPHPIPREFLREHGRGADRQLVIDGVDGVIDRAAEEAALFSELGVSWARPPAAVLGARHG